MHQLASGKGVIALLGTALGAMYHSMPDSLHRFQAAAILLFVLDFFTGSIGAALQRDSDGNRGGIAAIDSKTMRLKLEEKMLCYLRVIAAAGAFSLATWNWNWMVAGWGAIAAVEAWSNIENIRKSATTAEMAPIRFFSDRLMFFLQNAAPAGLRADPTLPTTVAVTQTTQTTQTTEVTVKPTEPSAEPSAAEAPTPEDPHAPVAG